MPGPSAVAGKGVRPPLQGLPPAGTQQARSSSSTRPPCTPRGTGNLEEVLAWLVRKPEDYHSLEDPAQQEHDKADDYGCGALAQEG